MNVIHAFVLFLLQHRSTSAFRSLVRCFLAVLRGILDSAERFTVTGWMFSLTLLRKLPESVEGRRGRFSLRCFLTVPRDLLESTYRHFLRVHADYVERCHKVPPPPRHAFRFSFRCFLIVLRKPPNSAKYGRRVYPKTFHI